MKKILSLAAFALFATAAMAQSAKADLKMQEGKFAEAIPVIDAEIAKVKADCQAAQAKTQAKGKAFDSSKFDAKLAGLYNQNSKCWAQLFTPELMKAAENAPLDTAAFVKSLDYMIDYASDSYKLDKKGKFAADNLNTVNSCLDYYFYAGYFLSNSDKEGAAKYFQKHIDLPKLPMFDEAKRAEIYANKKDNYEQAAFYACILNYELQKYDKVLESVDAATGNPEYAHDLYFMKAESALKVTGDSTAYINVVKEAVNNLEDNSRFCETLLAIYYERQDAAGAHQAVDEILAKKPTATAHYMKGCVYMNIEHKYAEARESFAKALALNPEDANANGNMAFAYINEGRERRLNGEWPLLDRKNVSGPAVEKYNAQLKEFQSFYENALPYMEKYRELQPEKSKTWAPALQQIFANLGRQAEADAMDEIMAANARGI